MGKLNNLWKRLWAPKENPQGRSVGSRLAASISLVALVSLSYVSGAAVMFFALPSSGFMAKAFIGIQDWRASGKAPAETTAFPVEGAGVTVDQSGETCDGFTLITRSDTAEAHLLDMSGKTVHRWKMSSRRLWPRSDHVREPLPDEAVYWDHCYVYPNGDLLALCIGSNTQPYGYGLAKFDKDSRLLWGYSANVHHDCDVGDDGRIYTLTQEFKPMPAELHLPNREYASESLVVLSPEGRELDSIPLYEAFRASPFFFLFQSALEQQPPGIMPPTGGPTIGGPPHAPTLPPGAPPLPPGGPPDAHPSDHSKLPDDILHSNSVKVLSTELAPKFPLFKAGMVLISLRTSSLLAVLDLKTRSVVWAARGPWRYQHDGRFLENGHLLLFDNSGTIHGSRVLEYDPVTQAIPWSYSADNGTPFRAAFQGESQRLPNGNTLIILHNERIIEVTRGNKVVWQWSEKVLSDSEPAPPTGALLRFAGAKRFIPDELTFLKGNAVSRPK
jgi:hypothetical protein